MELAASTVFKPCRITAPTRPQPPQVMVPQKPPLSLTVTWALPHHPKDPGAPDTPFWRCLQDFLDGDDAVRANIFKLIPRRARPDEITALSDTHGPRSRSTDTLWRTYFSFPQCASGCGVGYSSALRTSARLERCIRLSRGTILCRRVDKGSWMVRQAVGQNNPVLLGKKLTTKYFTGPNYVEVRMCWLQQYRSC